MNLCLLVLNYSVNFSRYGRAAVDGKQENVSLIPWRKWINTAQLQLSITVTGPKNAASLRYIPLENLQSTISGFLMARFLK